MTDWSISQFPWSNQNLILCWIVYFMFIALFTPVLKQNNFHYSEIFATNILEIYNYSEEYEINFI